MQEIKNCTSVIWPTLTYDNDHLPYTEDGEITLRKKDFQDFIKRLRHHVGKQKKPIKYYACGEYGDETSRPHFHAIIYNLPQSYIKDPSKLEPIWQNGYVYFGPVNEKTIRYTCKYIMKSTFQRNDATTREPQSQLISKGLGQSFLTPQMKKFFIENERTYAEFNGYKIALPRYYREKIFKQRDKIDIIDYQYNDITDTLEAIHDELTDEQIERSQKQFRSRNKIRQNNIENITKIFKYNFDDDSTKLDTFREGQIHKHKRKLLNEKRNKV